MTAVLASATALPPHVSECCEMSRSGADSPIQDALIPTPRPPLPAWSWLSFPPWGQEWVPLSFCHFSLSLLMFHNVTHWPQISPPPHPLLHLLSCWFMALTFLFGFVLRAAGSPGVPHPFLLLRDVPVRSWVAHALSEPTAAGLPRLEVSRDWPVACSANANTTGPWLIRACVAGTRAGPWWAPQDSTTPPPSWTPTSWPSVRRKAGANWPSTSCPSSTISTGRMAR